MMRQSFSTRQTAQPVETAAPPKIQIWAPDDVRNYALVREEGETLESYEERKRVFDTLLKLGGA